MKAITFIFLCLFSLNLKAQFSCATAVNITSGYTSGIFTSPGTSVSSPESWVSTVSTDGNTSNSGFTNPDVYTFQYTTGALAGESFYFTIECDYAVDGEHSIGVWTGCSGNTLSSCIASTYKFKNVVGICAKNLAANTTYYIGVGKEWASSSNTATGIASRKLKFKVIDFTVETSLTTPSDECSTAALINIADPYSGSTRCSYTASASSPSACGMAIENDSWMKFTAGSSTVVIDYAVSNCTNGNGVQLSVFSGTCGSLSLLAGSCVNYATNNSTGTWTFTGLTVGNTYYIRTDGYANDLCSYSFNPVSGIIVLPIELSDFKVVALENGFNKLTWKTLSENNSDYITVEKSANGIDFFPIESYKAAGNSSNTISYLHLDKSVSSEVAYYRLKLVDRNGAFRYSEIKVVENTKTKDISIYPNPSSSGTFKVNMNTSENINEIHVYSNLGIEIQHVNVNQTTQVELDLSSYTNGVYFVKLVGNDKTIERKILVSK